MSVVATSRRSRPGTASWSSPNRRCRYESARTVALRPRDVDQAVLDQRKAFLRPDLARRHRHVDGRGRLLGSRRRLRLVARFHAFSEAARHERVRERSAERVLPPCTNQEAAPPADCTALAADPACALPAGCTPGGPQPPPLASRGRSGAAGSRNPKGDPSNMRCFDQKRRYGMEFLYPTSRYVRALTEPEVPNRAGELEPNPLFKAPGSTFVRDKSMILYAGLVGVPWQDAATEGALNASGLEYLKAERARADGRFELFLGDPQEPRSAKRAPLDPLMIASPNPRAGTHPLTGEAVAPSSSQNPQENSINGHESVNTDDTDLQYACIFPLAVLHWKAMTVEPQTFRETARSASPHGRSRHRRPNTTRRHTWPTPPRGAWPESATPRSWPRSARRRSRCQIRLDPSYGYNPALAALTDIIIDRFELCYPRPLNVAPDGELPCRVAEALPSPTCNCSALPSRTAPARSSESAVNDELEKGGHCGGDTERDCNTFCVARSLKRSRPSLTSCQNDKTAEGANPAMLHRRRARQTSGSACSHRQQRARRQLPSRRPAQAALRRA